MLKDEQPQLQLLFSSSTTYLGQRLASLISQVPHSSTDATDPDPVYHARMSSPNLLPRARNRVGRCLSSRSLGLFSAAYCSALRLSFSLLSRERGRGYSLSALAKSNILYSHVDPSKRTLSLPAVALHAVFRQALAKRYATMDIGRPVGGNVVMVLLQRVKLPRCATLSRATCVLSVQENKSTAGGTILPLPGPQTAHASLRR